MPVAITHANPREYVGTGVYGAGRQKTTEAIKALAARRGVIGLSPNRNMTKRGAATTLEEFGDMVAWVVDRIGVDAVGIGSDYCPGHTGAGAHAGGATRAGRARAAPAEQMTMAPHEGWSDWVKHAGGPANIVQRAGAARLRAGRDRQDHGRQLDAPVRRDLRPARAA